MSTLPNRVLSVHDIPHDPALKALVEELLRGEVHGFTCTPGEQWDSEIAVSLNEK